MWTAPCSQGEELGFRDLIACVHMSGLLVRSHMNAGQDGFRDARPKHRCDQARPLAPSGSLTSGIDQSRHLFVLLQAQPQLGMEAHRLRPTLANLYATPTAVGRGLTA